MTKPAPIARVVALTSAAVLVSTLAGCAAPGSGPATRGAFVLDGEVSEWRDSAVATADDRYVYLRFQMEGDPVTLQNNAETTRIAIDADNNPETGLLLRGPDGVGTLGIDLDVRLSPHIDTIAAESANRIRGRASERGEPAPRLTGGVSATRYSADGSPRVVSHADIDFALAPTYAPASETDWVEARIGRLSSALLGSGLDAEGAAKSIVLLEDADRTIVGYADPVEIALPRAARDLGLAAQRVPAQQPGTIRVLSFNVLFAKPAREPEAFARVITSLAPDVILFQEFGGLDGDALADWLDEHVGPLEGKPMPQTDGTESGGGFWHAVANSEQGVAVASAHPIARPFADPVTLEGPDGAERTARAVSALLDTPFGDVLATSVHLKCCGAAGSREDQIRMLEADAINAAVRDIAQQTAAITGRWPAVRVIGGDINLVGTRPPLDALADGLDADGTDLTIAEVPVLGDRAFYTWSDPNSAFSPGRLDWILYSDESVRLDEAFVLDLGRLTRESVAAAGLVPSDTAASDHLPVVVDLRPQN
ncbi:MAG: endonuclease/exonuclease/phosphatase family protein [Planctomycetota bacterium]